MICRTQPCRLTRSQFKVTGLSLEFCVWAISPLPLGGFSLNFGQMFTSVGQCAEPIIQPCGLRSRSQLKVASLSLEFGVGSISPLPLEGFSLNVGQMFASVRWFAEPITELCWLKVKVTIEGHHFWPWILRLLHCHSDCLVKFGSNVRLSEMICRTYNSMMQTQGQGHNWKSSVSFLFAPYLLNPLKDFHETLVNCLP